MFPNDPLTVIPKGGKQDVSNGGGRSVDAVVSRYTDTERLDWLEKNASKLGMVPDMRIKFNCDSVDYLNPNDYDGEYTNIRKNIDELMSANELRD